MFPSYQDLDCGFGNVKLEVNIKKEVHPYAEYTYQSLEYQGNGENDCENNNTPSLITVISITYPLAFVKGYVILFLIPFKSSDVKSA